MSKITEKFAAELLHKTGSRIVIVACAGMNQDPTQSAYTVRCHPLLDGGIPNLLRRMADEIERKQKLHLTTGS